MGTIVAVKKDAMACIGVNCFSTRDPLVKPTFTNNHDCIFHVRDSLIAIHATLAFQQAFENLLTHNQAPGRIDLSSRMAVHNFFVDVHAALRSNSFMLTQFQAQQDFEWTPMSAIVLNQSGLYKVDSARGVFELNRFWAMGTGENFALGALQASFESSLDATEIAKASLLAVRELSPIDTGEIRIIPLPAVQDTTILTLPEVKSMRRRKGSSKRKESSETLH